MTIMDSDPTSSAPAVHVDLPDDLTAAGEARVAAREVAKRWRLAGVVEPLQLVVSELVGNAVRHGRPPVDMWLRRVGKGVRVDVHDEATESAPEVATLSAPDAESGRGMFLVDAVSAESGVEQIPDDGKVSWARVEPEPPAPPASA
jgi:anti-sigma regulatory factor (Ser/Thr protein kinase)